MFAFFFFERAALNWLNHSGVISFTCCSARFEGHTTETNTTRNSNVDPPPCWFPLGDGASADGLEMARVLLGEEKNTFSRSSSGRKRKEGPARSRVCVSQACRSTAAAGPPAPAGRTSRTGCGTRTAATWRSSRSSPGGWPRWRRRLWSGSLRRVRRDLTHNLPARACRVAVPPHLSSCWWTGRRWRWGRASGTAAGRGRRCAAEPGGRRRRTREASGWRPGWSCRDGGGESVSQSLH